MSAATWPEGVIGRYVTVGGGFVDLIEQDRSVLAKCFACPRSEWTSYDDPTLVDLPNRERSTERAGEWAQDHAATCRAVPKPGGAR
ncbi:hypothetical protein [Streptomyces sp. NPDC020983]|uniref:hypothetical protein n=1 Tax=Streptomyces sp. NPDC020983 TaxID=3365106 RepID=UPI003788552E